MKKITHLLFLVCLAPAISRGQSQDQNYIRSQTYKIATTSSIASPTPDQANESITYFDGLGRPIQQVEKGQSATGKNIVTPMEYDAFGRQAREYLPYATQSTGLNYQSGALTEVLNYPEYQGQNPWNETLFENSPLNRELKQSAPGAAWAMGSGKETKMEYKTNIADEVKLYRASATWNPVSGLYDNAFSSSGFYGEGQLYKSITKDENWTAGLNGTTEEFSDKEGKILLKRTYNNGLAHDTYYVYDQYGNLAYVIPPLATNASSQLDGLCFQYKHDYRNRVVEKKLPGKQWEFIVYDRLDRIVATGPAYSPFGDSAIGWLITKYDVLDRIAYTGWMQSSAVTSLGRSSLQNERNVQASNYSETKIATANNTTVNGIDFRYSNLAWPKGTGYHVLSVNYYDDYNYPNAPTAFDPVEGEPVFYNATVKPKGLQTGTWTRVLQSSTMYSGELSYYLYDSRSRAIRNKTVNHLGGHITRDSKLDFMGKMLYSVSRHSRTASTPEIYIKEGYTYSNQDRLLVHTHQIGESGIPQLLAKNEYDELGQLMVKRVGGTDLTGIAPLQKVDYSYNIRGWLKEINKTGNLSQIGDPTDLFAFSINYETVVNNINNEVKPLYNGNISETFWITDSDNNPRSYGYKYDNLNRLTKAIYQKNGLVTNAYNEEVGYDMNGNIITLDRNGNLDSQSVVVGTDDLIYSYHPSNRNRLMKLFDATNNPQGFDDDSNGIDDPDDDFTYDDNGNMTSDQNKGITQIVYNHLNLPVKIVFDSENRKIEYIYNAVGTKVQKIVTQDGTAVYINYLQGFQYNGKTLLFFPTAEGYVNYTESTSGESRQNYNYVYNYTDHLGNIRLSYGIDPLTGVLKFIEENHYYPFGLKHTNYNSDWNQFERTELDRVALRPGRPEAPLNYKYKYNGKELQDELGLNVYDYGARFYDPATGRWYSVDQMAEKYYDKSGYNYALNNPVIFIDPDGNEVEMCCDGLKQYLSDVWDGVSSRAKELVSTESLISIAYPEVGLTEMLRNPKETAKAFLTLSYNSTPQGIVMNAVENPKALGETMVDGVVVATSHKVGTSAGKTNVGSELQKAANKASATVGEGSGAAHGTKVHSEFAKQTKKIKGASAEISYKDGRPVKYGTKGSVRADAVVGDIQKPKAIYDLKTGGAKLTPKNVAKYNKHVPGKPPVKQIKPKR